MSVDLRGAAYAASRISSTLKGSTKQFGLSCLASNSLMSESFLVTNSLISSRRESIDFGPVLPLKVTDTPFLCPILIVCPKLLSRMPRQRRSEPRVTGLLLVIIHWRANLY
jgi:hypothetical protein